MSLTISQTQKLKALMLASHKPAFFVLNDKMQLLEWSDHLEIYGFEGLQKLGDASEYFDFLVGYSFLDDIELPIISMPSGVHASVSSVREGDQLNVLILDASKDFEQQYLLQQKANDAQLYNMRMKKLMLELVETQKLLEHKNELLAESSRLQSRFLSGVSHEFRTPLTSLIGFTEVLQDKLTEEESKEQLNIIRGSARYMLSLVENLLDHGRLDSSGLSLQFATVNIKEFVDIIIKMLQPLAEAKNITLKQELFCSVNELSFDPVRVQQCIINVVNNAIKFTEKGAVSLQINWQDDTLFVNVVDTGIGMDKDEINDFSTAFWQSKNHNQPGTGLGMTITNKLIEMMGGEISVNSKLGVGTRVSMKIPAGIAKNLQTATSEAEVRRDNSEYHILIVEDDDDIADLLELKLSAWGYQFTRVINGHECIKWVGPNQADLILMDLSMPVMTGEDALKYLRETGCTIPVYIMSAKPLAEGSFVDAQGQILKPIDFELLNKVLFDAFAVV